MAAVPDFSKPYRVDNGRKFRLKDYDPADTSEVKSKKEAEKELPLGLERLIELQDKLYAQDRWALLVILQAMDAAGKDGVIKHVMSGVSPQGCEVHSFKQPSVEELDHDFMWRAVKNLPERGHIGIFNRSYYEEVLIARVHPEILQSEGLVDLPEDDKAIWRSRYHSILGMERHLHENGTRIVKFFLHLSREEQRQRFLQRIDDAEKNWKFSQADIEERAFWPQYMKAYEKCLSATSTKQAPWYIVPADDKDNARLIVSEIILQTLEGLKMSYPETSEDRRRELLAIRAQLET
jgi:PPK2 family polyphosphate:nucleotide phosphotransferase